LMIEKSKDKEITHLLLENYFNKEDNKKLNDIVKRFREIAKRIKKDKNNQKIFEIEGINVWSMLEPQFSAYFNVRMKDHIRNIIAIDNLIEQLKPKVVVTPGETSEFDKGLFLACKKRNIPVIAIQHGILNDLRCIHNKSEIWK